jgi:hypothetical protein
MRYTLITQIVLLVLSTTLIFTFIKPAFGDIKMKQDRLFLYKDTVAKLEELNQTLQSLVSTKNAFSSNDLETLNVFIPETIDSLKVMRDIESMFVILNKPLLSLTPKELVAPRSSEDGESESPVIVPTGASITDTVHQDFEIKFVGTYFDAKQILEMLERNETLLEVVEFSIDPLKIDELTASVPSEQSEGLFTIVLSVRTFGLTTKKSL